MLTAYVNFAHYSNDDNNYENLYSVIIRNAEALSGKNVSHDAAKRVSFQSLFKSCQQVQKIHLRANQKKLANA